jgi:phosphotriesterase-related protein
MPVEDLGMVLPHEHVYLRAWEIPGRYDFAGQLELDDVLDDELTAFVKTGGGALVDLTVRGLGQSPVKLRDASIRVGLPIIMGCGWYREPYYPAADSIDRKSVSELAETMLQEIAEGVAGTGIRPGIIGEIGVDKSWVSAQEERVHRAAARAQRASGLSISLHAVMSDVGLRQLDVLEEEGADLARVVVGHVDLHPTLEYATRILERGAYVEFDNLGEPTLRGPYEARLIDLILRLLELGYEDRILLSHDVCKRHQLSFSGGGGYTYLSTRFLPVLATRGVEPPTLEKLTVHNPQNMLVSEQQAQ